MPRALTVTAIIAAFNEEDVIGATLADLVGQGVRVHLLDHGSTDGTVAEAKRFVRRGLVKIEHLDPGEFSLARIIRRKEALAAELESDWFVNADADEFRESPWPGVGFVEALQQVDRLGYSAIDFAVLNFPPVHDGFRKGDDPRESFRFYEPGAPHDRLQVRCWKKQPGPLDLVSTAGHEARFADRRVFPLRFLLRHYPIRGQAHGERKVFQERLPRFAAEERAHGWHVQYDGLREGASFLREPSSLTPYDPWTARLELALRHRGVEALEENVRTSREDVDSARAELLAKREELVGVRNELVASRGELAGVRGELSASRDAFTAARDLSVVLERELEAVRRERDELLRVQAGLRAESDAHMRESSQQRLELERLQSELRHGAVEVSRLRQELATLAQTSERRLAAVQYRIEALLRSRSWRWMGPLRALLDGVARR